MSKLRNIKNSVFEIAQLLGQDDTICRLLVNDSDDPLNDVAPGKNINDLISDKYIALYTPTESAIADFGRNTFIAIVVDSISLKTADNNSRASISIYASTDLAHALIRGNKNRLLEICDRVENILENTKLSTAGTISVTSIQHVMLSELHDAYKINCNLSDQVARKAEI